MADHARRDDVAADARLLDLTFRFDVVEVLMPEPAEIRVIENAFHLPSSYYY